MKRISLIKTNCKKCGKELYTTNRSLYGLDALKAEAGSVCEACTSAEEAARINAAIGESLAGVRE